MSRKKNHNDNNDSDNRVVDVDGLRGAVQELHRQARLKKGNGIFVAVAFIDESGMVRSTKVASRSVSGMDALLAMAQPVDTAIDMIKD